MDTALTDMVLKVRPFDEVPYTSNGVLTHILGSIDKAKVVVIIKYCSSMESESQINGLSSSRTMNRDYLIRSLSKLNNSKTSPTRKWTLNTRESYSAN